MTYRRSVVEYNRDGRQSVELVCLVAVYNMADDRVMRPCEVLYDLYITYKYL